MDAQVTINELREAYREFVDEREWDQYHDAKSLGITMVTEAAEFLEHFRFSDKNEVQKKMSQPELKKKISEELADVLGCITLIADKYNLDISEIFFDKIKQNKQKYPVHLSKGKNKKYNEYEVKV